MRTLTAFLVILLLADPALADCSMDTDGVRAANYAQSPPFLECASCRSAQDFPQDFIAAANNFFFHTSSGREIVARLAAQLNPTPARQPICNDHGQCVTTSVDFLFEDVTIPLVKIPLPFPTLEGFVLTVTTAGGEHSSQTYSGPTAEFQIPADASPDTIPDGECRNSNGTSRDTLAQTPPDDDGSGDPYDYFDSSDRDGYADAYNDLYRRIRCGSTRVDDGEPRLTCTIS